MKFLINQNVCGWCMTGIIGHGCHWFFGFSREPDDIQDDWVAVTNRLPNMNQKVLFELDSSVFDDGILTGYFREISSYNYCFETESGFKYSPIDITKWRGID